MPLTVLTLAVILRWMPLRLTAVQGRAAGRGAALTIVLASSIALLAAFGKYFHVVWG